jgi:GTP-binding protein
LKVRSEFVTSAAGAEGFPKDGTPELAMVGRSNVGKSTLINALVRQKLARTSAAPGKTRLANFYRVTPEGRPAFCLVDLPGYGYARALRRAPGGPVTAAGRREQAREEFDALAQAYFEGHRESFRGVLVLVDSRHPGLDADQRVWNWLDQLGVNRHVVATKVDKLTRAERARHLSALEQLYSTPVTPVSADTGEGLDELWKTIGKLTTTLRP